MSAIALRDDSLHFEPLISWYRKRPTQMAFAASLVLHALLIAAIPGFRAVPVDTVSVLSVQIVNEQIPVQSTPVAKPPVQEREPVVVPMPPELAAPAPQPRVIEQAPVVSPPPVIPQQTPVLSQPRIAEVAPVARAELAPTIQRPVPDVQPLLTRRPELAPAQPTMPVIAAEPLVQIEEPLLQPAQVRPQQRRVRQAPAPEARSVAQPDLPTPQITAPVESAPLQRPPVAAVPVVPPPQATPVQRAAPPVVATVAPPAAAVAVRPTTPDTTVAPPPVPAAQPQRQAAPVKRTEPQLSPSVAPPVAAVSVKPAAPVSVTPTGPVVELVEPSVLDDYRLSVSKEVMKHMQYPRIAVLRKWQGKTVVEMQLSVDGAVTAMAIAESSGKDVLDEAALKMVKQSLPLPKPPRGVRTVKVPVVFRLQG